MLDYMRALRKWFAEEPDCRGIESEIEELHRSLRKKLDKRNRRRLLRLIDLEIELRDEIAVANFLSGFKLAWGIAKELGSPYSFAADEEERACEMTEREVRTHG